MPIIIFLYIFLFSFSERAVLYSLRDRATFCRDSINGKDQGSGYCYWNLLDNGTSINIAEHNFHFAAGSQLFPLFLKARTEKGGYYSYPAICNENYFFPEAYNECKSYWQNPIYNGIKIKEGATGATVNGDGKYFVPYCFTMKNIYLYRIIGLGEGKCFELVDVIPWKRQIESAKFFGKYLVLIDLEYINILELKGQKLKKIADIYFPHPIEEYHYYNYDEYNDVKFYDTMDQYFFEYPYLYLLLEHNLDGYGPIVTFKVESDKIKLIDKGIGLPCEKCNKEKQGYRQDLKFSKINKNIYFLFADYYDYKFFKSNINGSPFFLFDEPRFYASSLGPWKDEYLYFCCTAGPISSALLKFAEEGLEETGLYSFCFEFFCSDTECFTVGNYMFVNCFYDELPEVNYEILPDKPVSQNFLVSGTAYDSEGIRGIFSGSVYPYLWKAEKFKREDGTIWWMAKMEEEPFKQVEIWGWKPGDCKDNGSPLITIAEDSDLDTNMSFDNPYNKDLRCIKVKEEKDPLPFGYLEEKPKEEDRILKFSGWALDNSGIKQGWLFSEDANILIPINYGIERQDVKEKYPEYPNSLNSGFSVVYDISNLDEGVYEFTLRLMANDYQVLDFGPFKIVKEKKHKRPF